MKRTSVPISANSAKYLIIVESPSKCKKIESFLGKDYACIASMGHFRHIAGLASIDTKNQFAIQFEILPDKKDHVNVLKTTIKKFSKQNVILATDDDREGEAIAWHICEECGLDTATTKRILFHEITEPALKTAVQTPTVINMNLVRAAHARQVLDMLVGFKISPLLWKYLYCNKKNSLSAGRCQTPALRLVYDNAQAKLLATASSTYKITAIFLPNFRVPFCLQTKRDFTREKVQQFLEESKQHQHILSVGKSKETFQSAPKPFNTSQLLQTASSRLHMSPKETMALCQKLYQDGWITYMRTDSTKYAAEFLQEAAKYIGDTYGTITVGDLTKIEIKDAANPHEAIRVTHIGQHTIGESSEKETARLCALYRMIWRNTVESCMACAKYEATQITITSPDNDAYYLHILEIPLFLGWKSVNNLQNKDKTKDNPIKKPRTTVEDETDESEEIDSAKKQMTQEEGRGLLMYLRAINGPVSYQEIMATVVMRNMHTHYSQASLIKKLEELGIGRPSTFAMLTETIEDRGYVKCKDVEGTTTKITEFVLTESNIRATTKEKTFGAEKKKLVIQPVGIMTIEFLTAHFEELFSYDYTKYMEMELDGVSSGDKQWHELCEKCNDEIKGWLKPVANTIKKEIFNVIQGEPEEGYSKFVVSIGKFGPVLKRTKDKQTEENDGEEEDNPQKNKKKVTEYRPIKRGIKIDMDILKKGKYTLEELLEVNMDLGEYDGFALTIKEGQYGAYAQWGENRESLKGIGVQIDKLEKEDIVKFLQNKHCSVGSLTNGLNARNNTRTLNECLSVRVGKYGPYIFYKTASMKKPAFYPMKNCPHKYTECNIHVLLEWINTTYKLNEKIQG